MFSGLQAIPISELPRKFLGLLYEGAGELPVERRIQRAARSDAGERAPLTGQGVTCKKEILRPLA